LLPGSVQVLGPVVELLEIVGGVIEVLPPVKAEPAHVALDGVDIFLFLLDRIGVVEAQIAVAAELQAQPEIEADRLGVSDMQIAVRLRRKAGDDLVHAAGRQIGGGDVADEVAPGLPGRRTARLFLACHASSFLRAASASQAGAPGRPMPRRKAGLNGICAGHFAPQLC
jgi:hypothetical protein